MSKKFNPVLKKVLENVRPSKNEIKDIENSLKKFKSNINKNLKKHKIKAEVFVGGSFAKDTLIKKDVYDIDLFLRFDKKYKDKEISKITEKIIKKSDFKGVKKIHGSRDYFRVNINKDLCFEVIPVLKINNPNKAENVTDLSYSHVKYINKKLKSKQVDDVRLAKAFCYANKCYGAESYIKGFSGYGLELLICKYKSFVKFLKEMTKINEKEIIDIEKHYKNKKRVLLDLNESKLHSPIILIDPTYKRRNALAGLSKSTFKKFQDSTKKFLENPSLDFFKLDLIDFEKLKKNSKHDSVILEIKTIKQKGDIAGSKLLKFYNHLNLQISKYFEIKESEFEYLGEKTAKCFFGVKKKKYILIKGPKTENKKHAKRFKRKHKKTITKKGRLYVKKKIEFGLKEFLKKWKKENKRQLKEMSIINLKIG